MTEEDYKTGFESILNDIQQPKLSCKVCSSIDIEYRVKQTRKQAKIGQSHIGAYCKTCRSFIKWVKQDPIILSQAIKPKSLF